MFTLGTEASGADADVFATTPGGNAIPGGRPKGGVTIPGGRAGALRSLGRFCAPGANDAEVSIGFCSV